MVSVWKKSKVGVAGIAGKTGRAEDNSISQFMVQIRNFTPQPTTVLHSLKCHKHSWFVCVNKKIIVPALPTLM